MCGFNWSVDGIAELGIEGVDVIVADVSNEESIQAMCARTKVLIDVVGPVRMLARVVWLCLLNYVYITYFQYIEFGEVVVRSCIKQKCDYVDITGETYVRTVCVSVCVVFELIISSQWTDSIRNIDVWVQP